MWYNIYRHIKALSVMERSMTHNVGEKTEDMLTNTLIPLGNRSLLILGS